MANTVLVNPYKMISTITKKHDDDFNQCKDIDRCKHDVT